MINKMMGKQFQENKHVLNDGSIEIEFDHNC